MSQESNKYGFHSLVSDEKSHYLTPFQRKLLLKNLQSESRAEYRRRIEIILLADARESQARICAQLGCAQETARYWITMTQTGQAHHWNERPIGRPKTVNDEFLDRLKELVSHSPRQYGYAFQRWTAHWLGKHLAKELGIEVSDRHINRLLKKVGLSSQQQRQKTTVSSLDSQTLNGQTLNGQDNRIVIGNLQSSASPEGSELWQFKSTL